MDRKYFEWPEFKKQHQLSGLSETFMKYSCLINLSEEKIYLSYALSSIIWKERAHAQESISIDVFLQHLTENSRKSFEEDIRRLTAEKLMQTDIQVTVSTENDPIVALLMMQKISGQPYIVCMVRLCYEMVVEYKKHLNKVVEELEHAQNVNRLILEGSTDYIYQLNLIENVCTFSPKALEVLPLESPTFGNAMDRILSFIVPEDRSVFLESFTPFLIGKSQYHTAEYRVNTKQGDIMWISCHGKGSYDEQGKPVMIAGSLMDITENKKTQERIHRMIYTDTLTGLKNRFCYEEELLEYMEKADAKGSIVCIDIRNFKLFNEIFGHNFGNKILQDFAAMLQMYLPNSCGIYRLEGDEFLIHLKESDKEEVLSVLTPLQLALTKARTIEGHSIYIDVTIGIAVYPEHGTTPDELLKNADTVLYKMSKYSNEKVMFFMNEKGKDLSKRYTLENELRMDIESQFKHFRMVFQPIVELCEDGNYWCSAEALLRYANPSLPDVTQKELIETLEVSDLIIPIGRWVLEQSIKECSNWHKTGAKVGVHVNFSAQQVSDAGLKNFIIETLKKNDLPPQYLICELTETSMINNFETAITFCRELMDYGIRVALDDFGTGYSSFNYLRSLPISQIKIDKNYVDGLTNDDYNQIIISCINDLSKNMNIELCVEGIETKEILDILADMGITLIQGFYFERPLEADVIRKEFTQHCRQER
ncbi:MAG: EAL domain-containing protein [Lachnospiraceae bacterium]|nr:EAL domain-containing protein [Lachnospiraceae bacterium]